MIKHQPISKHLFATLAAGTCALGVAVPQAYAQHVLEEVIVTAQKREQSLQDVPISVAVLGEEMLQIRGIDTLTDMSNRRCKLKKRYGW